MPDYYIMVRASREEGQRFKAWCRANKISMTRAFILLMKMVVDGDFTLRQKIRRNGKKH